MKGNIIKFLLAGCIIALLSSCATTDDGKPSHAEKKGKRVTIATGDFFEACDKFPVGAMVNYTFTSVKPVMFNIHYHDKRQKVYAVEEQLADEVSGSFEVVSEAIYCCMWENKNNKATKITYDMEIVK